VPRGSTEFAVGGALESEILLQDHGLANGAVFHGAQRVGVDVAVSE
jgi:hypothetical protein